jgi:hypothetical protein
MLTTAPFSDGACSAVAAWASVRHGVLASSNVAASPGGSVPAVTGVWVRGSAWTGSFLSNLANAGLGDANLGYAIPVGSGAQLNPLPWTNVNQISVAFSEDVTVVQSDLALAGVATPVYDISGGTFFYDSSTHVATWTLPTVLRPDRLMLELNSDGANSIKNTSGKALDGDWNNPTTTLDSGTSIFPSGNSVAGGNFYFDFNVLPGDVNQDGIVQASDGLAVRRCLGTIPGLAGYSVFADLDGNGITQAADGLSVRARLGNILPSGTIQTIVFAPAAPESLTFTAITTSGLTLNWWDANSQETGIRVYRSTDGSAFAKVADLAAGTTTFTDSGLAAATTYYYEVSAWNAAGETVSPSSIATTQALVLTPAAPTNLAFTAVTTSGLTVTWTDANSNESGVRIYRSLDGSTFAMVADLAADSTAYTDSGLAAGTTYYYEVSAWNSAGEARSTPASVTTIPTSFPTFTNGISLVTRNMTSFTELDLTGTSGNDSILVTQSNGILSLTADGQTVIVANTFGNLVIHGDSGNDTITVDSSINIATLIHGGEGNDTISNLTTGKATIVTINNGINVLTGNGLNTGYWCNPGDTVNASAAETALGGVNRISSFYQPWSTDPANPDYVPRNLYGQNLRDPSDQGSSTRLAASSFWGLGPTADDINQTSIGDCYFMAPLASLANNEPLRLMNVATDLGDGTFVVRFRNGRYVRVDGDLSAGSFNGGVAFAAPGPSGSQWGCIFEKAYALCATGANTYASLNTGSQAQTFYALGLTYRNTAASLDATTLLNLINTQLSANHAMVANTNASITGAPLVASHSYCIVGAFVDSGGVLNVVLRNPWGVDALGTACVVTITYSQFAANFGTITYTTI